MTAYSNLLAQIDQGIYFAAARANIYGILTDKGHEATTQAMTVMLNNMIGSRSAHINGSYLFTLFVAWNNLSIFIGERPTIKVTITFRMDMTIYDHRMELDARMLVPHNIPAMEIMWA